jgi:hypothetical protein
MPANCSASVIDSSEVPRAEDSSHQHLLEIYASEINQVAMVWRAFDDTLLDYRPHPNRRPLPTSSSTNSCPADVSSASSSACPNPTLRRSCRRRSR